METKKIILKLRTERGMSQDELANKVMVTRQAVSRWENGDTERLPIFTEKIPLSHETDLEVFTKLSRKNESIYLMNICQSFLIEMQKLQQ